MNRVAVIDIGNDLWKIKTANGRECVERHALIQVPWDEYQRIMQRTQNQPPYGYIVVNDVPYAFGELAERRGADKRSGAGRYTKDYYGVIVAIMLSLVYPQGGEVKAFCSHAPSDVDYADDLTKAALGRWNVQIGDSFQNHRVIIASTFDEPVGGLMNLMLREDGRGYQRTDVSGGYSLVIDIGGHTTDFISVAEGGVIDQNIMTSEKIGIQEAVRAFEQSIRANFKDVLKNTKDIPPEKLRKAIRTGVITFGGRDFNCQDESRSATDRLLKRVETVYQNVAGGAAPWDNIILTGGGSAMLYQRLVNEVLDHARVHLADPDLDNLHLANVRGGMKLWRFYESEGIVS